MKMYNANLNLIIINAALYKLSNYDIILHYSIDDILNIYNGVGPEFFPKCIRRFLTKKYDLFLPAVLIHDLEFHLGGDEECFHEANERLRKNILICIEKNCKKWSLKYIYFRVKAFIFYRLCELFGFRGWNYV